MKVNHIGIYVSNLEKAKIFYETYFNGKSNSKYYNPNTGFESYFITLGEGARLELMTKPGIVDNDKNEKMGYAHIAISLATKEEVDLLTKKIVDDGYPVLSAPRTTGDGYYESCVSDCDGNRIELMLEP